MDELYIGEDPDDEFNPEDGYSYDEKDDFQMEIGAYERVGHGGKLNELLIGTNYGDKPSHEVISPEDRFLIYVDANARRFNTDHIVEITDNDINTMLEKSKLIPEVKYKNPIAYILGYLASNGGSELKHDRVMYIIRRILPKLDGEGGVMAPDVIRYARYWVKFL